jgi:hypothetical protein
MERSRLDILNLGRCLYGEEQIRNSLTWEDVYMERRLDTLCLGRMFI